MARIRINSVTFSDGTTVELPDITVILGRTIAVRRAALVDIETLMREIAQQRPLQAVVGIEVTPPENLDDLIAQTGMETDETLPSNFAIRTIGSNLKERHSHSFGVSRAGMDQTFLASPQQIRSLFGSAMLSRLGTEERLTIAKVGPSPHFTNAPETLLQYLYRDPDAMDRVNVAFTPIFNTTLRLDYSALLELKVRVGKGIERVSENPQLALREFQQYPMLDEQGDGMRSAAAVLIALEAVHRPVTLIDEPEAFLHPPQARALGRHLGTHPGGRQIVISTHSTDL